MARCFSTIAHKTLGSQNNPINENSTCSMSYTWSKFIYTHEKFSIQNWNLGEIYNILISSQILPSYFNFGHQAYSIQLEMWTSCGFFFPQLLKFTNELDNQFKFWALIVILEVLIEVYLVHQVQKFTFI